MFLVSQALLLSSTYRYSPSPSLYIYPSVIADLFTFNFEYSGEGPLHVALVAVLSWTSRKALEFHPSLRIPFFLSLYIMYILMYLV